MRFAYTPYTVRGTRPNTFALSLRPMVVVRVIGPGGDDDVFGRVYSRAEDTLLPEGLIPILGVTNLSGPVVIGGIGGGTVARFGTVKLEIGKGLSMHGFKAYVGFHAHPVPVFGLKGFLNVFAATFDGHNHSLDLIPN